MDNLGKMIYFISLQSAGKPLHLLDLVPEDSWPTPYDSSGMSGSTGEHRRKMEWWDRGSSGSP